MPDPNHLARALEEGGRRSREAVTRPVQEPLRLVVWRRHKWKIVGLVVLLVTELVLFIVGSTPRGP
ncbi:MAG: hypothetical protein AAB409_09485 [Gemmatimonadota bacterium]